MTTRKQEIAALSDDALSDLYLELVENDRAGFGVCLLDRDDVEYLKAVVAEIHEREDS